MVQLHYLRNMNFKETHDRYRIQAFLMDEGDNAITSNTEDEEAHKNSN